MENNKRRKLNTVGCAYRAAYHAIVQMSMYFYDEEYKKRSIEMIIKNYIREFEYYDNLMRDNPEIIDRAFYDNVETPKYLEKTNIKNAPKEKEDIWDEYNYR